MPRSCSTIAIKRAICAAHWAVLREPHLGAGAGGGPNEHCLRGLLLVIGALPEVADEPLAALLATVLEPAHSAVRSPGAHLPLLYDTDGARR